MLSFNAATGNLYTIIGRCGGILKQARLAQTAESPILTGTVTALTAQLMNLPSVQTLVGSAYISQLNNMGSIGQLAQTIAQQSLNALVYLDNPGPNQSLTQANITYSIAELIRQMGIAGATVAAGTVAATPGTFTGVGNGLTTASARRPFDGLMLANAFADTIKFTCSQDSYTGGATAGNESFSIVAGPAESNFFAFDWPLGSGATTSLQAINGGANNSQGNGLNNSGFETWTSNTPNNFVIEVGAAGTQVFKESSIVYDGVAALRLLGNGTTLTTLSQTFSTTAGTIANLAPQTQYSVNLFLRRDGTAAGAGTLVVELTDSTGVVINDVAGTPNTFSINLTTLTTNYASYTGVFRTPAILPANQKIRLRLTTALTSGRSIYVDKMSMGLMTAIGPSQIYVATHSGSIPFLAGDYSFMTVANNRGNLGGSLDTFQTVFSRLFPQMVQNGFLLPASSTPTINDGLIT